MKFALAAVLMATSLGAQVPALQTHSPAPQGSFQASVAWKPCVQDASADCATLTVPIDWTHSTGGTTSIALARRRATDPLARIGSLLVNPGGPGLSGVQMALDTTKFSAGLRSRFDIVGFDPRGTGASRHLSCGSGAAPKSPHNQAEFADLISSNHKLAQECTAADPLAAHLNTKDVAKDVEAIRIALGGEPLNWYGTSYGTEIGQQYAELFPGHIRTMVLDATVDHTSSALTQLFAATASAENTFNRFALWCRNNAGCALHGQNVGAIFDQVVARAQKSPLKVNGRVVTVEDIQKRTYLSLSIPSLGWPALGKALAILRAAPTTTDSPDPVSVTDVSVREAFCQDWNYSVHNYAQFSGTLVAAQALAPHLHIASVSRSRLVNCVGWPVSHPPHPLRVHGAPPILLVNSKHDPIAPYRGATNVSRQLPGSVLLTYEGDGHSTYPQSACVQNFVDSYLRDRVTPSPTSSCPDMMPS